jgi:putative phosphotransacetylase
MKISIGVSNRHVHLKQEHLKILFGEFYELSKERDLIQPGEYASKEYVILKTSKDEIVKVRVLGPIREYTQVEISKTDAYKLGLNPPVRNSGDLVGSSPITIVGPMGYVDLNEGCIIATRHIHITPKLEKELGLDGIKTISVKVNGEKGATLNNVHIKVNDNYAYELHIDTDDANANLIKSGDTAEIIK